MKVQIEVPEGKRAEWKDGVLTPVDDAPRDITERVKTFGDACKELGDDHDDVVLFRILNNESSYLLPKDVMAYLKLRIIAAALNEGWKPTFEEREERWFPWFVITHGEIDYCYTGVGTSFIGNGSHLVFRTQKLVRYAGKQFTGIWKDFLVK